MNRLKTIAFLLFLLAFQLIKAQPAKNWDQEKIRGKTYSSKVNCKGSPFFMDSWISATIRFKSGGVIHDLPIKYDGFIDELICFVESSNTIIQIEKATIKDLEFRINGQLFLFECRRFKNNSNDYRLFHVYYKGAVDLLCLQKVVVKEEQAGGSGRLVYTKMPDYYLFADSIGFRAIKMTKSAFIRMLDKEQKSRCRKIIRSNRLKFNDPYQFAYSISVVEKNSLILD